VRRSIVQRAFELGVKFFDVVSTLDDIQCEN
jgi:aryl-alcohol dehydrogenase-like predicted oxidoreductase